MNLSWGETLAWTYVQSKGSLIPADSTCAISWGSQVSSNPSYQDLEIRPSNKSRADIARASGRYKDRDRSMLNTIAICPLW